MTPRPLLRPRLHPSPVRPSFRPSRLPDRRFQKLSVTTGPRPDRLPGSMTVCIAAKSDGLGVIVTVSDMMLADDVGAMDVADIKTAELLWSDSRGSRSRWFCLYSGKPAIFDDLSNHIKEALAAAPDREWSSSELMREVENAYDAVI